MPNHGFITPPENQGHIVEVSYALVACGGYGYVIRRRYDQSDRETRFHVSKAMNSDEGDYWNGAPKNKRWRMIPESEAIALMEDFNA